MKIALITLAALIPAALSAAPTMGVFFDNPPTRLYITPPQQFSLFQAYVFGEGIDCFMNAAEFAMAIPEGLLMTAFSVPQGSLTLGDPVTGISITYWPPMDGWTPGYNVLCTIEFLFVGDNCWCPYNGATMDLPIRIVPHPGSGRVLGLCWPQDFLFDFVGLCSILCPSTICMGVEGTSWGAIKSLYR